jgi:hypothetical protein
MSTICSLLGVVVILQTAAPIEKPSVVAEKMKAFAFLVGEWEGTGTTQMGPGPKLSSKVKESVQFRLSGNALLVEGLGTAKISEDGPEKPVHESIGLITWDSKQNRYVMHAMTARAGRVEPTIEVGEKMLTWGFETGTGGKVRFVIKINDKGQWVETGEFSQDGKTWTNFMEMTLTRK